MGPRLPGREYGTDYDYAISVEKRLNKKKYDDMIRKLNTELKNAKADKSSKCIIKLKSKTDSDLNEEDWKTVYSTTEHVAIEKFISKLQSKNYFCEYKFRSKLCDYDGDYDPYKINLYKGWKEIHIYL
jgi:hypothetical protein